MPRERFRLAPMSTGIYWLTAVLLVLPPALLLMGARAGHAAALLPGALATAIYLFVWFYMRPSGFEVGEGVLAVVWPLRRWEIPLAEIEMAELIDRQEFRTRFGWVVRVGAGGLWGGFGLLVGPRARLRFYISRLDDFVLIGMRSRQPLLVTPEDPERFVRTLLTGG